MSRLLTCFAQTARRVPLSASIRPSVRTAFSTSSSSTPLIRLFSTDAKSADAKPAEQTAEQPAQQSSDAKPVDLNEELKKKDAQIKELTDKWRYALAESQNTLTRSQTQLADSKKYAVQSFAKALLEVSDVLEIAVKAAEPHAAVSSDPNFKNLFEGMTMTQKVLVQIFDRNGLKKFEPAGEKFDPYFHEGLLQVEDATKTPGTVAIVLKSGYKLHDRCLRAAQVGTVKAPSSSS